ncbi:pyridoxamine 5'-phosphate oxidase family protein [Halorarius litoreus]|uniref:pyridoxamine 5'-phosphate oxidase family protein n=1 Tax=Halorarius litoreus TaxID=2962676 RepID=UPI0020CDE727|nr:pyridoxamine 5'-phosphate oxidase family protein [Halorarius litoreus]
MGLKEQTAMEPAAVDALLGDHETGVLSLARDDSPYAIPISYGYDASNDRFYLRLVSTPESKKRAFLDSTPAAKLVVYEEDGETYRSVIATGHLEHVPHDELTVEHIEQYGAAKRPLFEVWAEPKPDLDIALYQLDAEELTGRRIVIDREA